MTPFFLFAMLVFALPAWAESPGFNPDFGCTLQNNLIAYWKLDEASGTRADSKGSNTLTDNNTVTQAAGRVGNAGQFTAANSEYLSIVDNADLSTGDIDFIITAWVYLDTDPSEMQILAKGDTGSTGREYFLLYVGGVTDRFNWGVRNTANTVTTSVNADNFGAPSINTWYFIAMWHDSANDQIAISVNNGTANTAATTGGVRDGTAPFTIGVDLVPTSVYWNGRIDEVGFWKKVLTEQERTDLYANGAGNTYNSANACLSSFVP